MTEAIFTPEQLAEMHEYHRIPYAWGAVSNFVNIAVGIVLLRYVVGPLYARCSKVKLPSKVLSRMWKGDGWAPALAFSLSYFAITSLLYLPLDVYFDYFHEHAFGMSKYTPGTFALDYLKSVAVTVGATSALTFGLFGLARRVRLWWAILGAVGAFALLFSAALDPYRARMYYEQKPLAAGELRERITALMAKAQIDFSDVLVEDQSRSSVKLQAYFAGSGPTRTIILNTALIEKLTTDEVLAAVGHESGHVHESRWPALIASALALIAFLFAADRLMRWIAKKGFWGVTEPADIRALPAIMFMFSLATMTVGPVSAAVARERERQADTHALELTGNPDAFASMLVKAARVNKMDPDPPRWIVLKGRTHPPIRERLEAVEQWKQSHPAKNQRRIGPVTYPPLAASPSAPQCPVAYWCFGYRAFAT